MTRAAVPLSRAGLLQLAGSVVLLSSAWPVTKSAVASGAAPLWFAFGRAGLSAVLAFALLGAAGRLRLPTRQDLPTILSVGLLQLAAFFAFAHAAVAWVPAGRTAILANVTTIFVVPLSVLVLGEAIPLRRWLAALLGVGGVAVLMGPWSIDWAARDVLIGHLFLLAAALCFAVSMTIVRSRPPHASMLQLLPWCFGVATIALIPVLVVHRGGPGLWPARAVWSMVYIGGIAGPLGTWCVMQAAAVLPAMVSSVGFLMTPAVGLLLATVLLGEPLGADLLLGAGLILAGVLCAAWPQRR